MGNVDSTAGKGLIIPFGSARLSERALRSESDGADGLRIVCDAPHVAIDLESDAPLRMSDGGFEFRAAPALHDLAEPEAQIEFVKNDLIGRCDLYNPAQRTFLERYFQYIAARIAAEQEDLAARIAPFGALYRLGHWTFSAWRPLPQAHLPISGPDGHACYGRDAMVSVDFAFWDGARPIAVVLTGASSQTVRRRRQLESLQTGGAALIEVSRDALVRAPEEVFAAGFPSEFSRFWDGLRFPSGPFRPRGLRHRRM